ncbi:MAG TPA: PhzF family phenazine biosynthesis protein [Candidatus Eremiobacteraceae bacterium]|nr:PhzF family phenazine biosynthesis protein [Candidatus Eremiobacteraceae bacterium]
MSSSSTTTFDRLKIPIYQLDAFSSRTFGGNPAAVCPLSAWLDDSKMQAIAAENNLAETAFFVPAGDEYDIRWFTPLHEIDLCGHATLASAYVVFNHLRPGRDRVSFGSKSGPLRVLADDGRLTLDFPALPAKPVAAPARLAEALGSAPVATLEAKALVAVYPSERDVRSLSPNFDLVSKVHHHGIVVTAPGDDVDFVSRFFVPNYGIAEDPATGSTHCTLTPYWAERLGKTKLRGRQLSARGGEFWCELEGDRVLISGHVSPYLQGSIDV